ncbi:hypothetical protein chiPu_0016684 [Chiloscyllium punctatum]|uniref:Uncharacterized protein n=2 Tax=Chiloscyllium punctatum TaxID=137246 RepID=A0A401T6C6_CHIPU|nr:hypothetical protein [Chiloscyllium punctatum]
MCGASAPEAGADVYHVGCANGDIEAEGAMAAAASMERLCENLLRAKLRGWNLGSVNYLCEITPTGSAISSRAPPGSGKTNQIRI